MGSKRARHDWATSRIKARFVVQLFNYIHSLWPRGLQHTRLPCPSLSPGVTQICPLSHWCHPIIPSSVTPFSSCPQSSSPATVSFPVSQFFASGGQSIGASVSILSMNIQDWFPLGWTDLISLQSKGLSRVLSNTTVQKHHFSSVQPYLWTHLLWTTTLTSACDYWKKHTLTIWTFVGKLMSLLFNMLSKFLMALLPRSRHFLNFMPAVTIHSDFGARENHVCHYFHCFPIICLAVVGLGSMILVFWMLSFKPAFSLSSFTLIKRLFSSSSLSAIRVVPSAYLRLFIFLPAVLIPTCASPVWHFVWCTLHINSINRVTIYSLDVFLSGFGTSLLFHVQF